MIGKVNIERVLLIFLIILILVVGTCQSKQHKEREDRITKLELENQFLRREVNTKGEELVVQKAIVTNSQSAIRSLTDTIFSLSKKHSKKIREVIAYYSGRTVTKRDTLVIPFTDTLTVHDTTGLPGDYIKVPKSVTDTGDYFKLNATINKDNLTVNEVSFPDTVHLEFVEKGGFLKKRSTEVIVKHTNPFVETVGMNSVIYKPKPKPRILEKLIFTGIGVFIGSKLK